MGVENQIYDATYDVYQLFNLYDEEIVFVVIHNMYVYVRYRITFRLR